VDDIKLEDSKRGDRVSSQIYQEILQYLYHRQVEEKVAALERVAT
jgi:MscS family membrane protein